MTPSSPADLGTILFFGLIAVFFLWVGKKRGFFFKENVPWFVPVTLIHVVGAYAIYILGSLLAGIVYSTFFKSSSGSALLAIWLNFITSGSILAILILYWRLLPTPVWTEIWKRSSEVEHRYTGDVSLAFAAWLLSFPLVLFVSNLFEYVVFYFTNLQQLPDQLAVQFLKLTFGKPLQFFLAVASIVLIAPLLEEILFRGFLQTFIRKHLGSNYAIAITSVCFAFFHYSADQGLGNIPIIASLITLACFLGFLYEKQGSLFAPIALHAIFNAISVLNLYFLGSFPGGI